MNSIFECRTCLKKITRINPISIDSKITDEKNVLQVIEEISSLQCSVTDPLPKYICKQCFNLLRSTVTFRRLIISSYKELIKRLCNHYEKVNEQFHDLPSKFSEPCLVKLSQDSFESTKHELEIDYYKSNDTFTQTDVEKTTSSHKKSSDLSSLNFVTEQITNQKDTGKVQKWRGLKLNTKNIKPLYSQNSKNSVKRKSLESKPLTCLICGRIFTKLQDYEQHTEIHKNRIAPKYHCNLCSKIFARKEYLLVHKRTHTGEKPFHCDICDKNFSQLASFYVHKKRLHERVIQGTCNYCGKKFVDKPELEVHIKRWHTGERPYLCEVCSATFVCNRTLQRHRKELHERKPCQKCGKMLGDYGLKKHLLRHKVLEDGIKVVRKKYTCEYCDAIMNFTSRRRHLEKQHRIKLFGRGDHVQKIPIKEKIIK